MLSIHLHLGSKCWLRKKRRMVSHFCELLIISSVYLKDSMHHNHVHFKLILVAMLCYLLLVWLCNFLANDAQNVSVGGWAKEVCILCGLLTKMYCKLFKAKYLNITIDMNTSASTCMYLALKMVVHVVADKKIFCYVKVHVVKRHATQIWCICNIIFSRANKNHGMHTTTLFMDSSHVPAHH